MAQRRRPLCYDPPSPPEERATSPKRKRIDSANTEFSAAQHDVEPRQLHLPRIDRVPMRKSADHMSNKDQPLTDVEVEEFLKQCKDRFTSTRADQERSESMLNRRMLNSITATQVTQARTGKDLLKLTNDLHDFARDLNEQERHLHQQRAKLQQERSEFNNKLIEATVDQMRTTFSLSQLSPASPQLAQDEITQLKTEVGHLEFQIDLKHAVIESLLSRRMIEEEARRYAEAKLKGAEAELRRLQATGHVLVNYPMPDGDETDDHNTIGSPEHAVYCPGQRPVEHVVQEDQKRHLAIPPPLPNFFQGYPATGPSSKDDTNQDEALTESLLSHVDWDQE